MLRLSATVMPYAWGSYTIIPELLGREPDGSPQAEAWWGAHPLGPSRVVIGGVEMGLDTAIERDPEGLLGQAVAGRFGDRLPFLVKVLAVDAPLSLQVHPTQRQARAGFSLEERAGVPAGAESRRYRDPQHKPELVIAVTEFHALAGFRRHAQTAALLRALDCPELDEVFAAVLRDFSTVALRASVASALSLTGRARVALVDALGRAIQRRLPVEDSPERQADLRLLRHLAERYPGDPGVAVAVLLQPLHLAPGEALFVPPGVLHAYFGGVCVEVQANSDNVLRGGLTTKVVDVAALLDALDVHQQTLRVRPSPTGPGEVRFEPPVQEFQVFRHDVRGASAVSSSGPQILLCLDGSVSVAEVRPAASSGGAGRSETARVRAAAALLGRGGVRMAERAGLGAAAGVGAAARVGDDVVLSRGEAVFVPGTVAALRLSGSGTIFRAGTNVQQRGFGLPRPVVALRQAVADRIAAAPFEEDS